MQCLVPVTVAIFSKGRQLLIVVFSSASCAFEFKFSFSFSLKFYFFKKGLFSLVFPFLLIFAWVFSIIIIYHYFSFRFY